MFNIFGRISYRRVNSKQKSLLRRTKSNLSVKRLRKESKSTATARKYRMASTTPHVCDVETPKRKNKSAFITVEEFKKRLEKCKAARLSRMATLYCKRKVDSNALQKEKECNIVDIGDLNKEAITSKSSPATINMSELKTFLPTLSSRICILEDRASQCDGTTTLERGTLNRNCVHQTSKRKSQKKKKRKKILQLLFGLCVCSCKFNSYS